MGRHTSRQLGLGCLQSDVREIAGLAEGVKFSETVEGGGDGPEGAEAAVEVVRGDRGGEAGDVESCCDERCLGHGHDRGDESSGATMARATLPTSQPRPYNLIRVVPFAFRRPLATR